MKRLFTIDLKDYDKGLKIMNRRNFWSYITNGAYCIGCTGGTVYVYDNAGNEIGRFKDIRYAYHVAFVPNKNVIVVKSTDGKYFYNVEMHT